MLYLKQSTASQSVLIGPFIDKDDGVTAETGLTIANTDIRLSANGGNMFAKTSGGGTHDEEGFYTITLDATDTATVGRLQLSVQDATLHLPVYHEFWVLEEAIYDAMFGASAAGFDANQRVDVGAWLGNAVTASSGNPDVNIETIDANAIAAAAIATDAITADKIAANAIGASEIAADAIGASELATDAVDEIVDQVWNELQSGHVTAGSFGEIATEIANILADTNELQADWTNTGRLDTILDELTTNIDAIETDTQDLQTQIGAAGAGLSAVPWNAAWDAEVESEANDALVAFFTSAATLVNLFWDEAMTETTGAPAVTGTFRDAIKWMFALSRNKMTQTATTTTLRNDADGADLATSTVSDDATTFTRGEWST